MTEQDNVRVAPGQGFNTFSGDDTATAPAPAPDIMYQGPGTYEPDGTYHPFDAGNPDPNLPDNTPAPAPAPVSPVPDPAPDPATDAPDVHSFDLVGKLVVVNGENGAKTAALVVGGYDGADYVNLLVFEDPQSLSMGATVTPRYVVQVEPGTDPGQFSEL